MSKILAWFSSNMDKVCHFCVCLVISLVFGAIIFHTTAGATALVGAACGLIAALIIGFMKEVYDGFIGEGIFDLKDLLADAIGGIVGGILLMLLFV